MIGTPRLVLDAYLGYLVAEGIVFGAPDRVLNSRDGAL